MQQIIDKLVNSNIRVVSGNEIPHPSSVIDIMKEFGDIKMAKLSGKIDGLDDDLNEVQLINNYLIEVNTNSMDEMYETLGIIISQSGNFAKIYSGNNVFACTNLIVMNASFVKEIKEVNLSFISNLLKKASQNLPIQTKMIEEKSNKLREKLYGDDEFIMKKGQLLSTIPLSCTANLIHAESLLRNDDNIYYDMPNSDWKLLNMLTDNIKNEGINNRIKKTLLIESLF